MSSLSPKGKFSAFELLPNQTYQVIATFSDYDKRVHEIGERWTFLRKSFLPYDDGLSLFVAKDGTEQHIRLQCREEEQEKIVQKFSEYVTEL